MQAVLGRVGGARRTDRKGCGQGLGAGTDQVERGKTEGSGGQWQSIWDVALRPLRITISVHEMTKLRFRPECLNG